MQAAASDSADDSGSDVITPNTVYAREVAQLFVSGRQSQFKDASSRFGSLEGSRTLSSRGLPGPTPTPSLPSSESIVGRDSKQQHGNPHPKPPPKHVVRAM